MLPLPGETGRAISSYLVSEPPQTARLNTALGSIKIAIIGTFRSFDGQHTGRYLAAFEWRFNRRFDLVKNVEQLARVAVATAPAPCRPIAAARPAAEMTEQSGAHLVDVSLVNCYCFALIRAKYITNN